MAQTTSNDKPGDEQLAADLDLAIDAILHGRPFDRDALLSRHPSMAGVLNALLGLTAGNGTATPPRQIGPYRIERELGAGGFGVVYLGFDPDVKRQVAVKVLHPGRINPEILTRFQREAHAIGRLRHPGIVGLFDYSRVGPPWFLVTEYVEGVEPRQWCRQKNATPAYVADLVAHIADAVQHAHANGVCHRDLKPGNILVDADGKPHVLDFGLARLDPGATAATAPTVDGHILGSLPYMPPEQASGHSHTADARSDVYSLGVILYELLTGQLPFQGPAHELPTRVMEADPLRPRRIVPTLPRDLEAICLKALARRPQDRYATAADLASDLRAHLAGAPVAAQRLGVVGRALRVLDRRQLETLRRGWPPLLLLTGCTILVGNVMVNYWELTTSPPQLWLMVLLTKCVQFVVMVGFALWLWPSRREDGSPGWRWTDRTPAERQVLSLVPGYYGGYLIVVLLNLMLAQSVEVAPPGYHPPPIPLAPVLAMLAAMGFLNLGATIWGWFYVWGLAFFALAVVIGLCLSYGSSILGVWWFVCLVAGSLHLHWSR